MIRYAAILAVMAMTVSYGAMAQTMTRPAGGTTPLAAPTQTIPNANNPAITHETAAAPSTAAPAPSANANNPATLAANAQHVIDAAARDITNATKNAKFLALMQKAKGIYVVPGLAKGAFIVGGGGGEGVLVARRNGGWSDPAFMTIGSVSIGAQVGGRGGPVIMLIMSDRAMDSLTGANNFSFNANASFTIVNFSTAAQSNVDKGDIIIWSKQSGAFAGASIGGTDIKADGGQDAAYYGQKRITTRAILDGKVQSSAAAQRFVSILPHG